MSGTLERFRDVLREQATPRSLIGLGFLLAVLAVLAISSLAGTVAERQREVSDLARSVAVQRSLAAGQEWLETATRLHQRRDDWEARFWRGSTSGIVSAQLQSQIEETANQAGLERIRVDVQPLPDTLTDSGRLVFEITVSARDRQGQFLNFFQQLAAMDSILVPTDFDWGRGNLSVRTTLLAPAIVETGDAQEGRAS